MWNFGIKVTGSNVSDGNWLEKEGGMERTEAPDNSHSIGNLSRSFGQSMMADLEDNDAQGMSYASSPDYDPIDAAKPVESSSDIMNSWNRSFGKTDEDNRRKYATGGNVETDTTGQPVWLNESEVGNTPMRRGGRTNGEEIEEIRETYKRGGKAMGFNPKNFHDRSWTEEITPEGKRGTYVSAKGKRGTWSEE